MKSLVLRLMFRLAAIQASVTIVTAMTWVAFAPKLVLMESSSMLDDWPTILGVVGAVVSSQVAFTAWSIMRLRRPLRALGSLGKEMDPQDVIALYRLPARLTNLGFVAAVLAVILTLMRPSHLSELGFEVRIQSALLALTMASVATLPDYVMLRGAVVGLIERVPEGVVRAALALVSQSHSPLARLRVRIVLAVTLPVFFVSMGSTLLVLSHIRNFETVNHQRNAQDIVRALFDENSTEASALSSINRQARRFGYTVGLSQVPGASSVSESPNAKPMIGPSIGAEVSRVAITFPETHVGLSLLVYILMTVCVTSIAALVGSRLGDAFATDLAVVTREVRSLGVADVIRGTKVQRAATFTASSSLMQAIDEVGGLFREFASTQERAIEARAASERMRGLFLASMSHDLKAPLNAILGFSELASRNPLSEPQRESLAIIEQRGRELLHLIETILDAARTEAGELRVSLDLVPIADVIAVAMASSRELVFGQPVVLESQLQPGMPRVMVDPTRFAQALTLVVLTGVHLAVQGIVRVRATMAASGDRLRIDVDIPGSNSSEEPASLFDAFHNLEAARRHGSLGLGLSLARSIIELHQGKIEVQATMQSATEFHIWLPVVERGSGLVLPDSSSP